MSIYQDYMREDKFPHIWCPGCGHGIATKSVIRAISKTGIKKDDITMVSGIGCSSRTPGYLDFNTLHTTHGRALPFATGVKMAKPEMTVIVVSGDGDATAIGGNHFIHAARRNIDMTYLIYNNYIYGMTGGQYSPTTPQGRMATTAPYGNIEPPFDICELAAAAGATFVARGTVYQAVPLDKLIEQAIKKKGFSVVEVLSPCPTAYGRRNKQSTPVDMLNWLKDNCIAKARYDKLTDEEKVGKVPTGVLLDIEKPEYMEQYALLMERAQANNKKK
ncbi:MAG: 2-oxoacid:ferredoxin oxidoreductase subunit beta [Candidatus Schekmanbacteria bacterium]|nr:2-oxoacid:ferredoxin oxidoreductase subunit beta [Candidatus Schekmanbacteria bacterium]